MTVQLPLSFVASITGFQSYPENLIHQTTYHRVLKAYKSQLDDKEKTIFTTKEPNINVPFRDLISPSLGFEKRKIQNDNELEERLGGAWKMAPSGRATHSDPRCRFIFLYGDHSISPLKISRRMLVRILSYHQVMPSYLDFLLLFGVHKHSREKRFSGFRQQILFKSGSALRIDPLGRSGCQFQLCFNLKTVARWTEPGQLMPSENNWSIRQGAFHHQFDADKGTSLWIVTRSGLDIKQSIEDLTGKTGRPEDRQFNTPEECLKSSLAVHLLLCHWSTENWRVYFQWLEDTIEDETYLVVYNRRGSDSPRQIYSPSYLQRAHYLEEQTSEAMMVLQGNIDVLSSLRDFYQTLAENNQFPLRQQSSLEISSFVEQVDSFIYDSNMQIKRGQLLAGIILGRKTIILQHLQSQATEKMETLTTSMQKDSHTVRVIAFLTFIYLPATFVSTFFSTDIVHYQNQGNDSEDDNFLSSSLQTTIFSSLALNRWLQVTLPLTFFTFVAAIVWLWWEDRKLRRWSSALPVLEPKVA